MALHVLFFELVKLLNFDFDADPDPAFYSNADPDPYLAFKNNADPDPQPCLSVRSENGLQKKREA
jgi:hypothetical protein